MGVLFFRLIKLPLNIPFVKAEQSMPPLTGRFAGIPLFTLLPQELPASKDFRSAARVQDVFGLC